ncbi:type II secretion system protein GspM [Gilvimarinus sp. 1_MG-2023]|uniref:type II secretion system protein GspM n=1 Tax=Gilvimarinus sp. 1_MG-2023 TaxID=3062638 RepID=UPI0026E41984|nr:type II secretion system protein GspM [Gilvimarinus sp. 1_MG-2023]MDO6746789.1 type II secretion system protein GspM [Gilvimarinus sp. 1_MG-2023]
MRWLKGLNPSQWVVVIILTLVVTAVAVPSLTLLVTAYKTHSSLARIEPRIARLKGLHEAEAEILASSEDSERTLARLILTGEDENVIGNSMQNAMRDLFTQVGVSVEGSRVLPFVEQDSLQRVRVRIDATMQMEQITQLLMLVADHQPIVVVDSIDLRPERRRNADPQALEVAVVLTSFAVIQN